MEHKSPCLAWLYLAQEIEMPFCVGDGAVDPLRDESDGDDVAFVGAVELLNEDVGLLGVSRPLPSPPPGCCAFALMVTFDPIIGT